MSSLGARSLWHCSLTIAMLYLNNNSLGLFQWNNRLPVAKKLLQEALCTKRIEYRLKVWQEEQNNSDKTNSGRLLVERR